MLQISLSCGDGHILVHSPSTCIKQIYTSKHSFGYTISSCYIIYILYIVGQHSFCKNLDLVLGGIGYFIDNWLQSALIALIVDCTTISIVIILPTAKLKTLIISITLLSALAGPLYGHAYFLSSSSSLQ